MGKSGRSWDLMATQHSAPLPACLGGVRARVRACPVQPQTVTVLPSAGVLRYKATQSGGIPGAESIRLAPGATPDLGTGGAGTRGKGGELRQSFVSLQLTSELVGHATVWCAGVLTPHQPAVSASGGSVWSIRAIFGFCRCNPTTRFICQVLNDGTGAPQKWRLMLAAALSGASPAKRICRAAQSPPSRRGRRSSLRLAMTDSARKIGV